MELLGTEKCQRDHLTLKRKVFEIIDAEIGSHHYNVLEWDIVRRVIHATADFDFAGRGKIIFHKDAIQSAFNAIKNKCNIVTDVEYGTFCNK